MSSGMSRFIADRVSGITQGRFIPERHYTMFRTMTATTSVCVKLVYGVIICPPDSCLTIISAGLYVYNQPKQ
ncbi:hypothetical protein RP20_CCG013535 [Aedes albopictus]|nr:hypothetical protein RP20_CCG013535 [Aedes albopictus]